METMTIKQATEEFNNTIKKVEAEHQEKILRVKNAQQALKDFNLQRKTSSGFKDLSDDEKKAKAEAHKEMIKEVKEAQSSLKEFNKSVLRPAKANARELYKGRKLDIKEAKKQAKLAKKQSKIEVVAPADEVKPAEEAPVAVAAE